LNDGGMKLVSGFFGHSPLPVIITIPQKPKQGNAVGFYASKH